MCERQKEHADRVVLSCCHVEAFIKSEENSPSRSTRYEFPRAIGTEVSSPAALCGRVVHHVAWNKRGRILIMSLVFKMFGPNPS